MEQHFYIASHKNNDICKKSSSGGAFTAITDAWFDCYGNKAVVYGCILDDKLNARHIRSDNLRDRDRMRGSKYIESDISGINESVENDLGDGLFVVFSGTPCQISGLREYLKNKGKEYEESLLTVEVLCHGVAEDKFFRDYIAYLEKMYKAKAVECNFRAKVRNNSLERMQITFDNGRKYTASSTKYDWFYSAYLKNFVLKSACYQCKFAKRQRIADISVGDNWADYEMQKKKAESLIISNSILGKKWVERAIGNMDYSETYFNSISKDQLNSPAKRPESYNDFWNIYENGGYLSAQKFIGNNTFKGRSKAFTALVLDRLHLIGVAKKIKRILKN